jgi:hypothetical protein
MASRSAVVSRGGRKPLLVLATSSWAEAAGVAVPMPPAPVVTTFCEPKFGVILLPAMAAVADTSALTIDAAAKAAVGAAAEFILAGVTTSPEVHE